MATASVPAAAAPLLAIPTGVHVVAASATSFTVAANPVTHARSYRLFASTIKSDVYAVNLSAVRKTRRMSPSIKPRLTISALKYTTAVYYYRFEAVALPKIRYSAILAVSLRPASPTTLRMINSSAGTYLTWSSVAATGFTIAQGTNRSLHQSRRNYVIRGQNTQFTPSGLSKGTTYYFRVRADNATSHSYFSAIELSATVATHAQSLTVMTYNVLTDVADGTTQSGQRVAAWNTQRKPGVIKLIKQANPDVISIQEGGGWVTAVHQFGGSRQVDSLKSALGSGYALAYTEIPPTKHGYTRTGNYILYRTSSYEAVGAGWHWSLDTASTAAYQLLRSKASGATLLFVAPHLTVGRGASFDNTRAAETRKLVSLARQEANGHPVIYAGDFNSYLSPTHQTDGPGQAMRDAHVADGLLAAQSLTNQKFNSANQYMRTPLQDSNSIDHIFVEPGVSIQTWREWLNVSNGKLVGVIPSDHNPVVSTVAIPF